MTRDASVAAKESATDAGGAANRYVAGWLNPAGKEVIGLDAGLKPYPFVTKKLGSGCRFIGYGVECRVVDRAGRLGAQIPGYLSAVLGGDGDRRLYLVTKPTREYTSMLELGVVDAAFKTILEPRYASIRCWRACDRLIAVKEDASESVQETLRW